jgi:hypothetical protein
MISWMEYWRSASQHPPSGPPFLLLASAEVTLGVKTILQLIKNHIWLSTQGDQGEGSQGTMLRGSYQTLYALGAAANQLMLTQVFQEPQVGSGDPELCGKEVMLLRLWRGLVQAAMGSMYQSPGAAPPAPGV